MNTKKEKKENNLQEEPEKTLGEEIVDGMKDLSERIENGEPVDITTFGPWSSYRESPIKKKQGGLDAALLEAQRLIQTLPKDAFNAYSKYGYTSAEAVIIESRRCLNAAGLVLIRNNWKIGDPFSTDIRNRIITHEFRLSHPASGESREFSVPFPSHEKNGTPLDKAIAGSLTSCLAYFLRDLLLIPRSDNDMNTRDDTDHEPSGKFSGRSGGDDRRPHKPRQKQDRSSQGKDLAGAATPPPEQFGPNWKSLERFLRDEVGVTNKKEAEDVIRWITLGKHEDIEKVKRDENLSQVITGCLQVKQEQGVAFEDMLETAANYTPEQKEEKSVEEEQ